jgi:hypothetical protein
MTLSLPSHPRSLGIKLTDEREQQPRSNSNRCNDKKKKKKEKEEEEEEKKQIPSLLQRRPLKSKTRLQECNV